MEQNQNKKQSALKAIFRGMKETFAVVVLHKPIKTEFVPQECSHKESETAQSEEVSSAQIEDNNFLVIEEEYQQQVASFIQNHSNLDVLEIPCFFNNEPCTAFLCVFPRVIEREKERPMVRDVISVTYSSKYDIVGRADYGTNGEDALQEFNKDIERLTPPVYKNQFDEKINTLQEAFPDIDFSEIMQEPIFINEDSELFTPTSTN